jgi:hypothetical protein
MKSGITPAADYIRRLNTLARAYRAAEVRIVNAYFARPRGKSDHLRWLRAQAFKEYAAIRPTFTALANLYPDVDRGVDRHDFEGLTEKLADETKQARLVMDLLEEISRKRVTFADLLWLPQDRKLARIRAKYSKSHAGRLHGSQKRMARRTGTRRDEVEHAAVTLTEGGGRALYRVCSKLKRQGIEGQIARVFREILLHQVAHKALGGRSSVALITDEASFQRAAKIICEVSSQRLRMRNEQFGFPLSGGELLALQKHAQSSVAKL